MRYFRLVLEYDGTDLEGWQVQPGEARTVQGCLIAALERLARGGVRVTGAGRTDAGVHAEGQVASVGLDCDLDPDSLRRALNGNLPRDIAVSACDEVGVDFDARRGALRKLYVYAIWNGADRSPLRARRAMTVLRPLDTHAMARAAESLLGEHDFAAFQATGSEVATTVREIFRLDVLGESGGDIRIEIEGSGFLRYMVRNIAGTLIEVGKGLRAPESLAALLASRDRARAGPTAQARGLTLVRVDYPPEPVSTGAGGARSPASAPSAEDAAEGGAE